jgi:hypothetical protein
MDAPPTITLRDVALRLARLPKSGTGKIADSKLLGLLKAGELKAGFHFPGPFTSWILISPSYWAGISSDEFRSIRISAKNRNRNGTFKVRLSQVANECVDVIFQHLNIEKDGKDDAVWREVKATLAAASRRYEVCIPEQDWEDYLQRHHLEEPAPDTKGKAGRRQKEGWRHLCVLVGAYLIKHRRMTTEQPKFEEAARQIHKIGKDEAIPGLPAWPTIKGAISEIYAKADTLSIN